MARPPPCGDLINEYSQSHPYSVREVTTRHRLLHPQGGVDHETAYPIARLWALGLEYREHIAETNERAFLSESTLRLREIVEDLCLGAAVEHG